MEDKAKELLISIGLMMIGFYTRIQLSRRFYTIKQIIALVLFGVGIVVIVDRIKIDSLYKLSIVMVCGLLLPNIVSAIIRSGNKSEDKATKKISKKINDILD